MQRVAIGAIMKQEAPYILEWVAYHKALGFEIIIADNGGPDDTSKLLTALHNTGIISRIDFRFKKNTPQIPAYRAIIHIARQKKIDIIGFLDTDEFFTREIPIRSLTPVDGAEFIESEFIKYNATQISYHWLLYGSKAISSDLSLPVLERFSHHANFETKENKMVKSFILVKEMFKIRNGILFGPKILTSHNFHGANKRWYIDGELIKKYDFHSQKISYNNGAILHFIIKTWEEYQVKANRGVGAIRGPRYNDKFFQKNDLNDNNAEIDQEIIKQIKSGISQIKDSIGNYTDIDTKTNFFATLKVQLMSIGFWDVTNHKLIFLIYKLLKRIKKFLK